MFTPCPEKAPVNIRGMGRMGFRTVRAAGFGEVLRGVSFTPGTRS
jgi:hypothetical protein